MSAGRDELRANLIAAIHDLLLVRYGGNTSEECEEELSQIIENYEAALAGPKS